jgi:glutamyl-Q tRNA(Asp) synthetase
VPAPGYVGRFAPSPTGALHLGSLTTAVASYLHAHQAGGEWLVRIDDIDPPREMPGAADAILRTLEALELRWDGSVLYQSTRLDVYRDEAERLIAAGRAFHCSCSRKDVLEATGGEPRYPGTCRLKTLADHTGPLAVRARVDAGETVFADRLQGIQRTRLTDTLGDYVIHRRDGLPAYHLANVLDDAALGITDVVRGVDLLESTGAHVHLAARLDLPDEIRYWHLPVIVNAQGQKLSKQTGARGIEAREAAAHAEPVLERLGIAIAPELRGGPPGELWAFALEQWEIGRLAAARVLADGRES